MKTGKLIVGALFALASFSPAFAAPAKKGELYAADPGEGKVYKLAAGRRAELGCELHEVKAGGMTRYYWAVLDPNSAGEALPAAGVAFFAPDGGQRALLPLQGGLDGVCVAASPDAAKFVLSVPDGEAERINRVYSFAQMKPLTSVRGSIVDWSGPVWVDERRFVYTSFDDVKMKKPGLEGAEAGYLSVRLFDTSSRKTQVLKAATPTDEYAAMGYCDGFVNMAHYYVSEAGQWAAGGIEGNEALRSERTYCWLPGWKPGEWWQTPKAVFSVDAENWRVFTGEGRDRREYAVELRQGQFPDAFSPFDDEAMAVDYYWFVAGGESDPAGGIPVLYVFTRAQDNAEADDPVLTAAFAVGEPERVRDVGISPKGERLIVAVGEENSQVRDLELYRLSYYEHEPFRHLATLRPAYGEFYWSDPWRVVYSALNLEADLQSGREPGYALDVRVYDSAVGEAYRITESSTLDSYQAVGLNEDGTIEMEQVAVPDFADWKDPRKEQRTRLKGQMPAAG